MMHILRDHHNDVDAEPFVTIQELKEAAVLLEYASARLGLLNTPCKTWDERDEQFVLYSAWLSIQAEIERRYRASGR